MRHSSKVVATAVLAALMPLTAVPSSHHESSGAIPQPVLAGCCGPVIGPKPLLASNAELRTDAASYRALT